MTRSDQTLPIKNSIKMNTYKKYITVEKMSIVSMIEYDLTVSIGNLAIIN